ncbi:MAG: hypothetical protein ACPGID_12470 [Rubricella sp.]
MARADKDDETLAALFRETAAPPGKDLLERVLDDAYGLQPAEPPPALVARPAPGLFRSWIGRIGAPGAVLATALLGGFIAGAAAPDQVALFTGLLAGGTTDAIDPYGFETLSSLMGEG